MIVFKRMDKKIDDIERKIISAMHQIKKGTSSPKESKIGLLFNQLKPIDQALYEKLLEEYKIILASWKKSNEADAS